MPASSRRRLLIWIPAGVLALLVLLVGLARLRPVTFAFIIESSLSAQIGGTVTVGDMHWVRGLSMEIRDLDVHVEGVAGPAGRVLSVDRMTVDIGLGGSPLVRNVRIHQAVLRLAEDADEAWRLNAGELRPEASGGASALPEVSIEALELESGVYRQGGFNVTGRATFTGTMTPLPDPAGGAMFHLAEVQGGRATLTGVVEPAGGRLAARALGIELGKASQRLIPFRLVRHFLEQLELEGEVGELTLTLERGRAPSASLWLDELSITLDPAALDIGGSEFWVRFGDGAVKPGNAAPRLFVESGRLEFRENMLEIAGLDGYLEGTDQSEDMVQVPYRVDFLLADIPDVLELESIDEALQDVRFSLDVAAHEISLWPHQSADLPHELARILAMFSVRRCDVDMELHMSRMNPGDDVTLSGRMEIRQGQGAYVRFPYPLHDLNAVIALRGDDIVVDALEAYGSGDSTVDITGRVEATRGVDVDVHITAQDVPLDSVLLSAVPSRAGATLLDLLDPEHLKTRASADSGHQTVDLDLHVLQTIEGQPEIRGVIPFDDMHVNWVEFPVPIRLGKGRIRWDERLFLEGPRGGPVGITTLEGEGVGTMAGSVSIPVGDEPAGGEITFDVVDEAIGPNLLSALDGVLGETARLLVDGALTGVADARGWVRIDQGDISYDISADVRGGRLEVTPALNEAVGLDVAGPLGGATALDLDGSLQATADAVTLSSMSVRTDRTDLLLDGLLMAAHGDAQLNVHATGIHAGRWIIGRLPADAQDQARRVWDRWQPSGTIDGSSRLVGDTLRPVVMSIHGLAIDLIGDRHLTLRDGTIVIDQTHVRFDGVQCALEAPAGRRSSVEAIGEIALGDGDSEVTIRAVPLRLGGPIVEDALVLIAGDTAQDVWTTLEPTGEVDLQARWASASNDWKVDIVPRDLQVTWNDTRLGFTDSGSSHLILSSEGVGISPLHGRVGESEVGIQGQLHVDPWSTDIHGWVRGPLDGTLLTAMGGSAWTDVLEAIELEDGGRSSIEDMHILLQERDRAWSGTIDGVVAVDDATFSAGVDFKEVDARLAGRLTLGAQAPEIDARIEQGSARVRQATLNHATGAMVSVRGKDGTQHLALRDITADVGGGRLHADGHVAGPDGAWSLEVTLVDAELAAIFPETAQEARDEGKRPSSGRVEAHLRLRGLAGDAAATAGVGSFRVLDGHLRTLPALVAIAQVVQLSSPVVGALSFVDVEYHINANRAILDEILLASGNDGSGGFSLRGDGTLDIDTFDVEARLRPRGAWPMVSDIIGLLQDQLYEIDLSGPIGDPEVSVVPLPGLIGRR